MSEVTDAEIEAGLTELLDERNALGDGCFGCGYGGWWGPGLIERNKTHYRQTIKRVIEAAKLAQTVQSAPVTRTRQKIELPSGGTNNV